MEAKKWGRERECKRRRWSSMKGKETPRTIALMSPSAVGETASVEYEQAGR
jgi:hypothetical protein